MLSLIQIEKCGTAHAQRSIQQLVLASDLKGIKHLLSDRPRRSHIGFQRRRVPGRVETAALRASRVAGVPQVSIRSEEHTSELQSLMRISYAVFCLKKKNKNI